MSGINEEVGLNVPKCRLSEFFADLEGKLSLLTGLVDYENLGLTLEDVRKPMLVISSPGIGKTCGIISSVKEMNKKLPEGRKLGFKKILLGQTVVGSLSGIPVARPDGSVVRIQMPDLPDPKRDGEYGVLFLDEITTADEMQIQPALGLADDSRSLGEYTLPEHWIVVGAGNGPDCTNFVRLDDMTISRFMTYDVSYDYKKDFRPYAHASDLNENVIAFLNFSPDTCVRVESTDMDSSGKLFPCPRTWERLSIELKMRSAMGKPVSDDDIGTFAGRIIGKKAGVEFGSFMAFHKTLNYSIDKILEGTEKDPEIGMQSETFHIILQGLIKAFKQEMDATRVNTRDYPLDTYKHGANMMRWLLKLGEMEKKLNAIIEMRDDVDGFIELLLDDDFREMCPEVDQFFIDHAQLICSHTDDINNMKF